MTFQSTYNLSHSDIKMLDHRHQRIPSFIPGNILDVLFRCLRRSVYCVVSHIEKERILFGDDQ